MRIDSIRTLRSVLSGTATSKLTDVLEAVFGVPEEFTPEMEEEEPDEAEEDLPAEGAILNPLRLKQDLLPLKVLNAKLLQLRLLPSISRVSLLRPGCASSKMQHHFILFKRKVISTQEFRLNMSQSVKVADTLVPQCTFASILKQNRQKATPFPIVM